LSIGVCGWDLGPPPPGEAEEKARWRRGAWIRGLLTRWGSEVDAAAAATWWWERRRAHPAEAAARDLAATAAAAAAMAAVDRWVPFHRGEKN
jgi:hypothetical protein